MREECDGTCGDCHCGELKDPTGVTSGIEGVLCSSFGQSSITADVIRSLVEVLATDKVNSPIKDAAKAKLEELINNIDVKKLI